MRASCPSATSGAARKPSATPETNARRSIIRSPDPPAAEATAGSSGRGPWRSCKELRDGRDKVGHVDGLALVAVEPGGHDLLPVLAHYRRGHGHDGNPPRGLLGSEPSERLDPVNPRQPNVHQDQARASFSGQADALFACLALDDLIPFERQHVPDELPVLVVVLDDQDERARHDRTGSVKVKVDP